MKHNPNKVNSVVVLDQYLMHCLSIANHCIPIRDRIMEMIVFQIIDIDAEISIPETDEDHEDLQFDLDAEISNPKFTPSTRAQEMAEKLDNIMNRIFDFFNYQNTVRKKGKRKENKKI